MPAFFSGAVCSSHCSRVLGTHGPCCSANSVFDKPKDRPHDARYVNPRYNQRVNLSPRAAGRTFTCIALLSLIVLVSGKWLHVNPAPVAVTLLLSVLAIAASWGLRYALPMSIAA